MIAGSVMLFAALFFWMHPRVSTVIDRRLTLAHLRSGSAAAHSSDPVDSDRHPSPSRTTHVHDQTPESLVEALLRDVRSGTHPRDALVHVARQCFGAHLASGLLDSVVGDPLPELLDACAARAGSDGRLEHREMFRLLKGCLAGGVLVPAALENAVGMLRTRTMLRAELRTATAQATLTARILGVLPFGALAAMAVMSPGFRHTLAMPITIVIIVVGIAVNRIGAAWTRVMVRRATHAPADDIAELTGHLAVALHTGNGITEALMAARHLSPGAAAVAAALRNGHRIEEALAQLPQTSASIRLTHTLIAAHRDGLPVAMTVHQLADDAHEAGRRAVETSIRRLPTTLAFPVVMCTLPSFLLITVAPMMLGALGQLAPLVSPRHVPVVSQGVT